MRGGSEVVAEADEVGEVGIRELRRGDNFDATFAEVAGLHDGFVF